MYLNSPVKVAVAVIEGVVLCDDFDVAIGETEGVVREDIEYRLEKECWRENDIEGDRDIEAQGESDETELCDARL